MPTPVKPTKPAVTFVELIRRAQAQEPSTLTLYCQSYSCGRDTPWALVFETDRDETYACSVCGAQKTYRVR